MIGELGSQGWSALNPTKAMPTDGQPQAQAFVGIAKVINATQNIHVGLQVPVRVYDEINKPYADEQLH